jgi:hypothetical protein
MKRSAALIAAAAATAVTFVAFVALAQAHAIFVPYFTPARIEFEGLEDRYPVNGSIGYTISLKGYGSNCVAFEAGIFREGGSSEEERVVYYNQIQDCRKIEVSQGPYNHTRNFTYAGQNILSMPGDYRIEVNMLDQTTGQNYHETRSFTVVEDSS